MGKYDSGCTAFVTTRATVYNYFPVDKHGAADIACMFCRYYREGARRCSLTDEVVPYPNKYVGRKCPLEPVEENKEEK